MFYLQVNNIPKIPQESSSQPKFDLPEYSGRPKYLCLVASTPRCGSSLLGRLLQQNGLGVPNEYLHPNVHIPFLAHRWGLIEGGVKLMSTGICEPAFNIEPPKMGYSLARPIGTNSSPFSRKAFFRNISQALDLS